MADIEIYARLLASLGARDERIVVVDAGLGTSMQTYAFQRAFPDRYLNLGIAEANAVSFASGLARRGWRPLVHSFSNFLARRAHDQIAISVAVPGLPVALIAGSCGVFDGRNGPSHFAGDDVASVGALAGVTVFEPADAADLEAVLDWTLSATGPTYLRLRRNGMPQSIGNRTDPRRPVNAIRLNDDALATATVVAVGSMLDETLTACRILADDGVTVDLVHVLRLKPLDGEAVLTSARRTGRVVVVENHVAHGGCAGMIAALLARQGIAVEAFTLPDEILPAGDPRWLLARCGLDATSLAERMSNLFETGGGQCSNI